MYVCVCSSVSATCSSVSATCSHMCECLNMLHGHLSQCVHRCAFTPHVAIAVGSAIAKQKQEQNGQKCKGTMANGKAKMTKGGRKMSKGKGNVVKGPRSLVHEKTPNGGKTQASGKTATGSLPRSKVKIQRSKVAKSKVGLDDIICTRVSSSKQADKAGFKRQQERCEVTAGKTKTVKEVVSGSLPATDRTQLVDILTQNPGKKVFIEKPHALARSTVAGE